MGSILKGQLNFLLMYKLRQIAHHIKYRKQTRDLELRRELKSYQDEANRGFKCQDIVYKKFDEAGKTTDHFNLVHNNALVHF